MEYYSKEQKRIVFSEFNYYKQMVLTDYGSLKNPPFEKHVPWTEIGKKGSVLKAFLETFKDCHWLLSYYAVAVVQILMGSVVDSLIIFACFND